MNDPIKKAAIDMWLPPIQDENGRELNPRAKMERIYKVLGGMVSEGCLCAKVYKHMSNCPIHGDKAGENLVNEIIEWLGTRRQL